MYARVARFTGADADAINENVKRMEESDGPPEGVTGKALTMLADEANGTVIVIGFFETEDDLRSSHEVLNSMTPPGGGMGTRASVDLCEVKLELEV